MDYNSHLQSYFENLGHFNYNQAKLKIKFTFTYDNGSLLFEWLNHLINLEKNFYSFIFVTYKTSGLLGRKKQNESYFEFKKQIHGYRCGKVTSQLLDLIVNCITVVCDYRWEMIEFLRLLRSQKQKAYFKVSDVLSNLTEIIERLRTKNNIEINAIIGPILNLINLEFAVLKSILEAHERTTNLYFLEPLNELQCAQKMIDDLEKILSQSEIVDKSSMIFIIWLRDFVRFVLEKYTLYFQPVLMRYVALDNGLCSSPDSFMFVDRIRQFASRQSPSNVCLLFDTTQQTSAFIGHGYVLPSTKGQPLIGLQNYQTIFSTTNNSLDQQDLFMVVSLIRDRIVSSNNNRKIAHLVHNNNNHKSSTLFVCKIECRVYLVMMFDCQKSEGDKSVTGFMTELSQQLQGLNIIEQLRFEW